MDDSKKALSLLYLVAILRNHLIFGKSTQLNDVPCNKYQSTD